VLQLYVPRLPGVPDFDERLVPERYGFNSEDVWLTAEDGTKLHAWLLKKSGWTSSDVKSKPVMVFFQENAGNMSHRLPFLRLVANYLQVVILAPSYRGYGMSEGKPSQAGLMQDAQAALDYVLNRDDINIDQVVVMGRSLGGAVAIHVAADNQDKLKALIVENTFLSVEDMASKILPPLGAIIGSGKPMNWLVTNKWSNIKEIPKVDKLPMLLLASEQDEMVPYSQMVQLHQAVTSPHCEWVPIAGAQHMDAYMTHPNIYWAAVRSFMDKYVRDGGSTTTSAM